MKDDLSLLQAQLTYKKRLESMLKELKAQQEPLQAKVAKLEARMRSEQKDVDRLEGGATVIVRPSGTEPKIKTYFTTLGKDLAEAEAQKAVLAEALKPILA